MPSFLTPDTLHFHTDPVNWLPLLSSGILLSPLALSHGHLEVLLHWLDNKTKKHPKWHGLHPHSSMHHGRVGDAIWTVQMGRAETLRLKLVHLERTDRVPPHPGKSMQALRSCWADGYFRFWERAVYQLCLPRTGDSYIENKNKSNI